MIYDYYVFRSNFISYIKVSYVNATSFLGTRSFLIHLKTNATNIVLLKHIWPCSKFLHDQIIRDGFHLLFNEELHPHHKIHHIVNFYNYSQCWTCRVDLLFCWYGEHSPFFKRHHYTSMTPHNVCTVNKESRLYNRSLSQMEFLNTPGHFNLF